MDFISSQQPTMKTQINIQNFVILIFTLLLFPTQIVFSQNVNVTVETIDESRSTSSWSHDNKLSLDLKIKGITIDTDHLIRVKEITNAVDDEGVQLMLKENTFGSREDFHTKDEFSIEFETTSRSATMIKTIEGILEYFTPSLESGSKVVIKEPLNKLNSRIVEMKDIDLIIEMTNQEALDIEQQRLKDSMHAALDTMKQDSLMGQPIAAMAEGLVGMFEGLAKGFGSMMGENNFIFKIEDPNESLVEINIYDSTGKIQSNGESRSGDFTTKFMKNEPTNDYTIEIIIKDDSTLKEIPFTITNVVLP